MALIDGTITISGFSALMVKDALLSKIRNPGIENTRLEFVLQEAVKTKADQELIELCYDYMCEISALRRNSNNGLWSWKSPEFSYSIISEDLNTICEICGCWLGESFFFTNQNHETWRK